MEKNYFGRHYFRKPLDVFVIEKSIQSNFVLIISYFLELRDKRKIFIEKDIFYI